jgi:hypothetical protein
MAEEAGNYRDKVFTPLNTLKTFLWQVLSDNGSCKEAVANVLVERIEQGLPANSVNTGPYCKARQRLPLSPIDDAFVATLEHMPNPCMAPIKCLRVHLVQPPHSLTQVRFWNLNQQMVMVIHQAVRVT